MTDIELKKENESIPLHPDTEVISIGAAMRFKGNTGIIKAGEKPLKMPRTPKMGTCGMMTTVCVEDVPGVSCFLHECARSRGYNNCTECPHWSNPEDPCPLQKVSRDFCPAISQAFRRSI